MLRHASKRSRTGCGGAAPCGPVSSALTTKRSRRELPEDVEDQHAVVCGDGAARFADIIGCSMPRALHTLLTR